MPLPGDVLLGDTPCDLGEACDLGDGDADDDPPEPYHSVSSRTFFFGARLMDTLSDLVISLVMAPVGPVAPVAPPGTPAGLGLLAG